MKKIAVIDYGMGNVGSVVNSFSCLGIETILTSSVKQLASADAYVLPGVGAFPMAMSNLRSMGLYDLLNEQVIRKKKPFLGICLGMQLLAEESTEQVQTEGLKWFKGRVIKIEATEDARVPHVGWNNIKFKGDELFERIEEGAHYYFDHSYHFVCDDPEAVIATCEYSQSIVSAIRKNNIIATQFHPEKSQRNGLKLLRNYSNYVNSYEA